MENQEIKVIKNGFVFHGNDSWEQLPENSGIVVLCKNGKVVAYNDFCNTNNPCESDTLEKNFIGAKMQYGDRAFLVKRVNDIIFCQKEIYVSSGELEEKGQKLF